MYLRRFRPLPRDRAVLVLPLDPSKKGESESGAADRVQPVIHNLKARGANPELAFLLVLDLDLESVALGCLPLDDADDCALVPYVTKCDSEHRALLDRTDCNFPGIRITRAERVWESVAVAGWR